MKSSQALVLAASIVACSKPRDEVSPAIVVDLAPSTTASIAAPPTASAPTPIASKPPKNKPLPNPPLFSPIEPTLHAHGDERAWLDVYGQVARTIDGGTTWTWSDVGGFNYETMSVGFDGSAWVKLDDEEAGVSHVHRFDGARWIDATPKLASAPLGSRLGVVGAFDARTAFTSRIDDATPTVLTLLSTHDGGATWTTVDVPTSDVRKVRFSEIDGKHAFALAQLDSGAELFVTDDGGESWHAAPNPPNFGDFVMRDGKRGWLLAPETIASRSLWRTDDGARSWTKVFEEGDGVEALPVFEGASATVHAMALKTTADGGATWKETSMVLGDDVTTHGANVWRVHDARVERSNDGGATWNATTTKIPGTISAFVATSARTVWAMSTTTKDEWRILVTHDGGTSWTTATPPRRKK